jgi:EF hand
MLLQLTKDCRMSMRKHFIPNFDARSLLLTTALVVGAATAVHAQTTAPDTTSPGNPPSKMAPPAAASGEKAVPSNRATAQDLDKAFDLADSNHDGKLNREEAVAFPAVLQRFERIDTDHDTFVSRAELHKAAQT